LDGALHVGAHLVEATSQDPGLLAGVRLDRRRRARRTGADAVAEPQAGAPGGRLEVEAPAGAGVGGVRGAPPERARLVADLDEARDRPLADRRVLVAPDEHGADAAAVVLPRRAVELRREPGRQVDVGDQ